MLVHRRSVMLGVLSAMAIVAVAACAGSDEGTERVVEDGGRPEAAPPTDGDAGDADVGEASVRTCSDQGFCHVEVPAKETLRDVWGDGSIVWAVSEEGHVLRWDGQKWNVHAKGLGALYAIWGSGPTDIWIGGERGVHHGTGASSQAVVFEPVDAPGDPAIPILSIWGTGPGDVVAVGGHISNEDFLPHSRVLRRGGAAPDWELDPISAESIVLKRVWGSTATGTWIAGDEGYEQSQVAGVFLRAPGADAFAPVTIDASPPNGTKPGVPGLISGGGMTADGRVLVVGATASSRDTLWYATVSAGGTLAWSYEVRDRNDVPALWAVWSLAGKETWIAGDYGRLRSRGPDDKWKQAALMTADLPVIEPLYGIWGTAADDFWVVGRNTAIHRLPKKEP
jgi:hypothetical protein